VQLVFLLPPLRSRFLAYGARASPTSFPDKQEKPAAVKPANLAESILDYLATLQVPHSWFSSFYVASVSCSLLWIADYALSGPISSHIAAYVNTSRPTMTFHQVFIVWLVVLAQGSRRLYECHAFSRASTSTMWVGHWVLGMAFYLGLSVAIWIEGTQALAKHELTLVDFSIQAPSVRTFISLAIFMFASGIQHDCHAYLASLKPTGANNKDGKSNYKLPTHPAYNLTVTPHYFAECLIYLSIAGMAAPAGQWLNSTVACALMFVIVNLGVTAHETYEWYERRFGKSALKGRWRMVPFIF
jgi:3-oxo-5-alpha-steroid 4-dehydrogenase 3